MPVPECELDWSYTRAGGPGGQNVNKVSSKAVLRWNMAASNAVADFAKIRLSKLFPSRITEDGDVLISSQEHRDQDRNRKSCREKLEAMIAEASTLPKPRRKSKPSIASKQKRLAAKKHQSKRKEQRRAMSDE